MKVPCRQILASKASGSEAVGWQDSVKYPKPVFTGKCSDSLVQPNLFPIQPKHKYEYSFKLFLQEFTSAKLAEAEPERIQ